MKRDGDGLFHPETEAAVQELVRWAAREQRAVRVRGSLHSPPTRVFTDAWLDGERERGIDLSLDRLDAVSIDVEARTVRVQAGCRFGRDPRDPTGRSRLERGLCPQLEAAGLAVRVLGGITHQTLAGYFATGSAGGSFSRSLLDDVLRVRLVTGEGELLELTPDDGDRFRAALTSLGLLGIVTELTLRVVPRFWVVGEEHTLPRADAPFSLTATGERSLEAFFRKHDFARVLWWPQPEVDRLVVWTADARPWDERPETPTPYLPMPPVLGSPVPMQIAASAALHVIGHRPTRLSRWLDAIPGVAGAVRPLVEKSLGAVYRAFVEPSVQRFSDTSWRAIPQDDAMEEALLPVDMTEVWVPVARAPEALAWLQHALTRRGYLNSGTFAIELYPGPKSDALLQPGSAGDAIRINPFFLRTGTAQERAHFFAPFFELARLFGGRHHWGKHLPSRAVGRDFAGLDAFLAVRSELDPHGRFLTESFRAQLFGEGTARVEPVHETPLGLTPFRLQPADLAFFETAPEIVVARARPRSSLEVLFREWSGDPSTWATPCTYFRHVSDHFSRVGGVAEETVLGLSLRMSVLVSEPGRRHAVSVDALNVPFAKRFGVDLREVDGQLEVRFAVELQPALARLAPVLRPPVQLWANALLEYLLAQGEKLEKERATPLDGRWTQLGSYSGLHSVSAEHHDVRGVAAIAEVLARARRHGRRVVMRGAGLSFDRQAMLGDVAISVSELNAISVDPEARTVTAEAGARWIDVVRACEPYGLLPAIIPSGSDITVGGSISVNSMSRFSPVWGKEGRWVKRLELLTPAGERVIASRDHEPELFAAVVGGFGHVAVVLSATYQLLPRERPMRVRCRVEKQLGLERLGVQLAREETRDPSARASYAVVSFDGDESRVLLTHADYVGETALDTMLPHRPGGASRVPIELAINWVPPAGQAFWNYAFDTYVKTDRDYVDELYGYTFFMDGNARARRAALAAGLPFRVAQQAWALPVAKGDAVLEAFIRKARSDSEKAGLRLSLVDVLTLPKDEDFVLSVSSTEAMHVVTVTWEGLDGAERAGLVREVCVGLTTEVRALGGRVHLTKNVFSRPADIAAMYAPDVARLRAVKRRVDPGGVLGSDFVDALFGRAD